MALTSESISKAFEIKRKAVKNADYLYENSLAEASKKYPEIDEINRNLSSIGANLLMLTLHGDTEKLFKLRAESEALSEKKKALLKKAGVKEKQIFCKACNDTGYIGGALCECIKTIAKEVMLSEMSKAMPLDKCSFENFSIEYYPKEAQTKMSNIYSFCQKYAEDFSISSENLLFMGKSGLGKTHLSLAIAKEAVKKGYNVVYGPAQNLFSDAEKEHFSYSGNKEKLEALLDADLLVIDDLGTEFITNFVSSLFYDIVNTRILKGKPTIISTNLTIEEIEKRYSARIASRFIGEYTIKVFTGNDIRLIKKRDNLK